MCKREGCNRPFYARGMCMHHYGLFMKRAQRRGLKIGRPYIGDQLKGVLPCTIKKVAEQLETHLISTQKAMKKLHAAGKIHIIGFEFTGARWAAIYALGKGVDATLEPAQIRALYNERRRASHAKRTAPPPAPASIFAALGL
jgi:hypothetical protein